ncbi:MAG TPA: hypothetical protein VFE47_02100 [Tepidisphaeraceae bacterium]|jgi:hypothetical protein|nr:hypothetical protein [Tepidisphaeraceae bacterium]
MEFLKLRPLALTSTMFFLLAAGCESPWPTVEPVADALIPPTNPWACEMSRKDLADTVGKPADINFFGDQAEYMGDHDGNRYVHVRDMSDFWGFLGECVYTVPAKDWPMAHPMPLTVDATQWQDVTWMGGDGPQGVGQNGFLHITPSFPLGAPKTRPSSYPTPTQSPAGETPGISTSAPGSPATATVPSTDSTAPSAQVQIGPTQPSTTQGTQPADKIPATQPSVQPQNK